MTEGTLQNQHPGLHGFALWRNPILWKNFKSRLRAQALFQCLLVFITSAFLTLIIYTGMDTFDANSVESARAGIIPLLIVQAVILMLAGTGRITSGVIHERVTGTLEYTRLTPMSPMDKVLGYLFGLPVREYILFAITVPFMAFLLIKGQIPVNVTAQVYLVFFSSVLLYHLIGLVFGLVLKEWRMSVLLTQGVVILINLVLPLFSNLGFPFLQYLTIRPVVSANIMPYLPQSSAFRSAIPEAFFSGDVAFFEWSISTTSFSLLLQGILIFTLGLMVYRKWESAFNHSLSKTYALCLFVGLQIFCIGTLWPNLVGNDSSSYAQGLLPSDFSPDDLAFILPIMFSIFSLVCVFWLLYVITPTHDEYRSGLIRDRKLRNLHLPGLPLLDDKSSGLLSTVCLALLTAAFIGFVQITLIASSGDAGFLTASVVYMTDYWKLPMASVLIIVYFYVALEYLELQKLAILILCLWIVPILLGVVAVVTFDVEQNWAYIISTSPIPLLIYSGSAVTMTEGAADAAEYILINRAFWFGTSFISLTTALLAYKLQQLQTRARAHGSDR